VIAVPGPATPENEDAAAGIANLASSSCRGAAIRIGFLRGDIDPLGEVLSTLRRANPKVPIVVVPLLAFPDPEFDDEIAAGIGPSCLLAAPLGPHPLLAAALHTRLAEVGLARSARVGRISIVTAADGVIVGAAGRDEAEHAAGVVGVLLASRLTIPVVPASLASPASLRAAVSQLQAARVTRVALAPCVIGPEIATGTLADITARTGIECAPPLGANIAIAQLVAIRYGAALEDPKLADLVGSG